MAKRKQTKETIPGDLIDTHVACPSCGSSDAMSLYKKVDNSGFNSHCFSCGETKFSEDISDLTGGEKLEFEDKQNEDKTQTVFTSTVHQPNSELKRGEFKDLPFWKISKETCESLGIESFVEKLYSIAGEFVGYRRHIMFNYTDDIGQVVAQKARVHDLAVLRDSSGEPIKDASGKYLFETDHDGNPNWQVLKNNKGKELKCVWYGDVSASSLFGLQFSKAKGEKRLAIVEGEKDAAAFVEICKKFKMSIAVLSVKNGAQGAAVDVKTNFQFINEFDEIYVIGDNDEAGRGMNQAISSLLPRKAKVVTLELKDVHEYLAAGKEEDFKFRFYNAKRQVPDMVKSFSALAPLMFEEDPPCYCTYPWESFNFALGGIHGGEVVAILGPEKIGKTSLLRNIAFHVHENTDDPVGVIFLEDIKKDLVKNFVSLKIGVNLYNRDITVPQEEIAKAVDELIGEDRLYFKADGGPGEIADLMKVIDWMIAIGCKTIFFDNVSTLIVGDTVSDSERQAIDKLIAECRDRATAYNVCIFVVQHLNRNGQPRGSHALPILSSTILEIIRDADAEDKVIANTTLIKCRGNRRTGFRGEVGMLFFEKETSRLVEPNNEAVSKTREWLKRNQEEASKKKGQ